ncbi:CSN-associated deubiquitinating enzyme Ubp12 [Ascosphaera pollenicola]|nr:CSN-associated deubiquitinating enzyme Ubp12 [Ascosphaera pollenicola]
MQRPATPDAQKGSPSNWDPSPIVPNSFPSTPEFIPSSPLHLHSRAHPVQRHSDCEGARSGSVSRLSSQGQVSNSAETAHAEIDNVTLASCSTSTKETGIGASQAKSESQASTRRKLESIDLTESPAQSIFRSASHKHSETAMAKGQDFGTNSRLRGHVTKQTSVDHPQITNSALPLSPENRGLHLDKAIKRHLDWTPVKDTVRASQLSQNSSQGVQPKRNLFAQFRYDAGDSASNDRSRNTAVSRQRTELLPVLGNNGSKTSSSKTASKKRETSRSMPAQKHKTITSHTTSKYRVPTRTDANIREFFHSSQEDVKEPEKSTTTKGAKKRKSRRKTASSNTSESCLVAPANAFEALSKQEWQFASASQLIRSHDAEEGGERRSSLESNRSDISDFLPLMNEGVTKSRFVASRGLWSAAARDSEGNLIQSTINDVITVSDSRSLEKKSNASLVEEKKDSDEISVIYESDISLKEDDDVPSVGDEKELSESDEKMPNFHSCTLAELTQHLKKYGLKPIRSKAKAIEMLEDCWSSAHQGQASATVDKQNTISSTTTMNDQVHSTPIPSSQKGKEAKATPQAKDEGNADPLTSDIAARLVRAIQSQPRPSGFSSAKQLTWHEKILLYDPISIDDLTLWLNTGGLDRVGEDREVSSDFVRDWCETRGICCYPK